ncbi:hypothetical protein GGTG_13295 [Gaeumannomyces tritici R3-111a-1]|uniref:Uncharacterized protein n=1 Tax=Gaeumannomyces tritici (strain R3-111a-1) TaxID=644352 RepID=J3PIG7_GAET3|nr:hypothetical protein GGTG_13295 [Gaeumannomyces tritici R3-111a-1]EJT69186.1 hypothetical protein GGTG_13295 [Gaeumannomyces tritici R3-111a-1]
MVWIMTLAWSRGGVFLRHRSREEEHQEARWKIPVGGKEYRSLTRRQKAGDASRQAWERIHGGVSKGQSIAAYKHPDVDDYNVALESTHRSRVFMSGTGYVGICPLETRPGDVLFVPCGAHVPCSRRSLKKNAHIMTSLQINSMLKVSFPLLLNKTLRPSMWLSTISQSMCMLSEDRLPALVRPPDSRWRPRPGLRHAELQVRSAWGGLDGSGKFAPCRLPKAS